MAWAGFMAWAALFLKVRRENPGLDLLAQSHVQFYSVYRYILAGIYGQN
jgi:hypothetical protein